MYIIAYIVKLFISDNRIVMKRRLLTIAFFWCVLISYHVQAKSFENQLFEFERIKASYGGKNDRYLDSLSKDIRIESGDAIRQLHINTIDSKSYSIFSISIIRRFVTKTKQT